MFTIKKCPPRSDQQRRTGLEELSDSAIQESLVL
nr:MAG TPA: hypothetical protein [Herelleviridae sp.]